MNANFRFVTFNDLPWVGLVLLLVFLAPSVWAQDSDSSIESSQRCLWNSRGELLLPAPSGKLVNLRRYRRLMQRLIRTGEEGKIDRAKQLRRQLRNCGGGAFRERKNQRGEKPIVMLGQDIVHELTDGDSITIVGEAFDPDGKITQLRWRKISGQSVEVSGVRTEELTVSGLQVGSYEFEFSARDNHRNISSDTIQISVVLKRLDGEPVPSPSPSPSAVPDETPSPDSSPTPEPTPLRRPVDLPSFLPVVELPSESEVNLVLSDGYTIHDLKGLPLDDLGVPPWEGEDLWVERDILPFRLNHFTIDPMLVNTVNQGELNDYLTRHGFNAKYITGAGREPGETYPDGTLTTSFRGTPYAYNNSTSVWDILGIPRNHYQRLPELTEEEIETAINRSRSVYITEHAHLMFINYEPLVARSISSLRSSQFAFTGFPSSGSDEEQQEFIDKYFEGVRLSLTWDLEGAARARDTQPNPELNRDSIYGWWLVKRISHAGFANYFPDPKTDEMFQRVSRGLYEKADAIKVHMYPPYANAKNLWEQIGNLRNNLDYSSEAVAGGAERKPLIAMVNCKFTGGGSGLRWQRHLPVPKEETRAQAAAFLFGGADGFTIWGERPECGSQQTSLAVGAYRLVRDPIDELSVVSGERRHDFLAPNQAIKIVAATDSSVDLQVVIPTSNGDGLASDPTTYRVARQIIENNLVTHAEPYAGWTGGLALVKPIERYLAEGVKHRDFVPQAMYSSNAPVALRTSYEENGARYHFVFTYDPRPVFNYSEPDLKRVVSISIGAHEVSFEANREARVYVVREELSE